MVQVLLENSFFQKLKNFFSVFRLFVFLGVFALAIGVTFYLTTKQQDIRQRASGTDTTPMLDPRISVSHVSGIYPNVDTGYLVTGAKDALSLGFQTIEIYLNSEICWTTPSVKNGIYQTLDWCRNTNPSATEISTNANSLRELALDQRYVDLFNLPFKTFLITTETVHQSDGASFLRILGPAFTQSELTTSYIDFYNLATLLLAQYKNTGKTFIIQTPNEMDWSMLGGPAYLSTTPNATTINNAINYWNVIQNAIDDAKKYFPEEGMHLYQGCEFNLVQKAIQGGVTSVNAVLPNTHCDLYGYSAYDTTLSDVSASADVTRLSKALDYVATKAPRSAAFGNKNIYISELGFAEHAYPSVDTGKLLAAYAKNALDWGVPFVNLWTLYDNECTSYLPTTDDACPGYWMRKPSGSLSNTYQSIKNAFLLAQTPTATPTNTPTPSSVPTPTDTPSPTPTNTPTLIPTQTPTPTPTTTPLPTATPTPTNTPTPLPTATLTPLPTATPTPAGKIGDINHDGNVNAIDLSYILSHWGSTDVLADLNHDNSVTIVDLSMLLSNWGK